FFFAWVASTETTFGIEHQVEDEKVVGISLTHAEGNLAKVDITVKNPRVGLLAPGRDQWAWLSYADPQNPTAGVIPLLFGRVVGVPQQVQGNAIALTFLARPAAYDTIKRALADSMKVSPYWDAIFVSEDKRSDPDSVLQGYTKAWHIDRVTHAVTASDILNGEDGLIDFDDDFIATSLDISYSQPPLSAVMVSAEINWSQDATGTVDFSQQLITAFTLVGSGDGHFIKSETGAGFMEDFPQEGDRIGGGWTYGACSITRADGTVLPEDFQQVVMTNGTGQFPVWAMKPVWKGDYDVSRNRQETVSFTLTADCQALVTDPAGEDITEIKVSGDADEPIDEATTDNPFGLPIGDVRNRAYLPTARGRESLEFLICLARKSILERGRAIAITFTVPFSAGLDLSCRKNARVADPRIPGGEATGKIIGYTLTAANGQMQATITIGCSIGNGNTVSISDGTPAYVEDGYVDTGYQIYDGQTYMPVAGEVTYEEFGSITPNDDRVDFFAMDPAMLIEQITIINPLPTQRAVLNAFQTDISGAMNALNQVFTEVDADFKVLKGGPFITDYPITVSALQVPRTINLEAA
ncbi:hypothetical protein, partial [Mesorhizobium sp. M2A.F.Ca.ET.067.02.1.1]|uniref:hypothetical protein n=1 Tax=Mesorhizobium sp. M2A.F.Ca.ET.067.02.1.1 TaxID=2496749 RepID=UPI001671D82D